MTRLNTQMRLVSATAGDELTPATAPTVRRSSRETASAAVFMVATVELTIGAAVEVAAADIAMGAMAVAATALAV